MGEFRPSEEDVGFEGVVTGLESGVLRTRLLWETMCLKSCKRPILPSTQLRRDSGGDAVEIGVELRNACIVIWVLEN